MSIQSALNAIEFKPVEDPAIDSEILYATHSGVLRIGDIEIEVHQLSNGLRVIKEGALKRLFGFDPEQGA